MKLTENQKILLSAVLHRMNFDNILTGWEFASDRHLSVDEMLELVKKLKMTVRKEQVKRWREVADMGKK